MKAINEGKTTDRLILKPSYRLSAKLTEANQLNYDLFRRNAEMAVEKQRFPGEYLALNQMDGLPRDVPSMIAMMPAENLAGYEDILSRLKGVPALVEQTIALLQEGLARGIVPPKVPLRTVADQVAGQIHDGALTSPMLSHFKFFPSTISSGEQARLTEAAKTVYTGEVKPAMERLHVFLRDEYVPKCRETVGRSALPNGEEWYDYMIRHYTTTSLSPDVIHNIGLSEVKRIRSEMRRLNPRLVLRGTCTNSSSFSVRSPVLLRHSRRVAGRLPGYLQKADPELMKLFRKLPRQPYGVVPIPAY